MEYSETMTDIKTWVMLAVNEFITPIQLQNILFIINEELIKEYIVLDFQFEPCHFGPQSHKLYDILQELRDKGFIQSGYSITQDGRKYNQKNKIEINKQHPNLINKFYELRDNCLIFTLQEMLKEYKNKYPTMYTQLSWIYTTEVRPA